MASSHEHFTASVLYANPEEEAINVLVLSFLSFRMLQLIYSLLARYA
jgi:hypothetical protein